MSRIFDRVQVTSTTTGTGTLTLGAAISNYWCTPADAGVPTGESVTYLISDGTNFELGHGTYTSSGTTLSRDNVLLSKIGGTAGTSKITCSGSETVAFVEAAEDIARIPHCGRLTYSSATALSFAPKYGDQIKINGSLCNIPSGGITGLANTGVYVNGTSGQNLAASTLYYVYVFSNAGTLTADFSTTAHATSTTAGNVGVEIKSGDDTRTLIGMAYTNASSQFADSAAFRGVCSWFNRRRRAGNAAFTANRTTGSSTPVEINSEIRVTFVTWSDEAVSVTINALVFGAAATNDDVRTAVNFDGGTSEDGAGYVQMPSTGQPLCTSSVTCHKDTLSDGNHYATLFGYTNASPATWLGGASAPLRTTLYATFRQ